MTTDARTTGLISFYRHAKQCLINAGYDSEIEWQNSVSVDQITESVFLRESAWVILSSGMRESVVRRTFPALSRAFLEWRSAVEIKRHQRLCRKRALRCFNNLRKVEAILGVCRHVAREGFDTVREALEYKGLDYIRQFPFMGPITAFHLAKNIGLPCAKPDRHLCRIAAAVGYVSVEEMCSRIAGELGEKISVVDLVLWRFATRTPDYLVLLQSVDDHG